MRKIILAGLATLTFGVLAVTGSPLTAQSEARTHHQSLRHIVENSRSENPQRGFPYDWLDCIERYQTETEEKAQKQLCGTWTTQGVTSSLYALKFGSERVPVIESALAGQATQGPLIVDIQGGPGGSPFYTNPAMTEELLERLRKSDLLRSMHSEMSESSHFQLLAQGFTIASLGYWGMSMRTPNQAGEIDLAIVDVRRAIDFYRDQEGREPPMITTSLGNHLALGALGKDRIETMQVLAIVPVMDGLQHHLERLAKTHDEHITETESTGELHGGWTFFNIYAGPVDEPVFDHSEMLSMTDYATRFFADRDFAWLEVAQTGACSRTILGSQDPRTRDYLDRTSQLPSFVTVLDADHDIFKDQPEEARAIYAAFGECLLAQ